MLKQEKILLKAALITSLIGLFLLIVITKPTQTTNTTPIDDVSDKETGTKITISGKIAYTKTTPNLLILTIEDQSGSIKVVANKKHLKENLKENIYVQVEGIIKEYNNKKEIEAEKIKIFS